ncbi:metallophosphoesterase [Candidatus Woesearchaeota archaeon]|nr:metallophosphoesterase [Candidatus Woesearchaeota archaeon]
MKKIKEKTQEAPAAKERKKLKILAVSDTHHDTRIIRELAEKAEKENVDLVILCGDFTHFSTDPENKIGPFLARGKKVFFIPGNHEDDAICDFFSEAYNVMNLHGKSIVYNDVGIFASGKAYAVGPNTITEDETFRLLQESHDHIKHLAKKVMVTHNHPAGTAMASLSRIVHGSSAVRKAVEKFQPDVLLCGHVHEADGIEEVIGKTRVINVAKSGKIIEI